MSTGQRPEPDLAWVHRELRRPGVTLELLHVEYLAAHPTGYRYAAFCGRYRAWRARQRLSMRQVHVAGEKAFVDYAGQRPALVDVTTGEVVPVELFVAVLGASNYTYAEATRTQQSADWIASHTHAVAYFGGVPAVWIPDQLRTGVTAPCRYEPGVQRTYADWAAHYGTIVIPARPAKPRDKAKVEVAVQVAERWILARLRHETFFSLDALNARIRELLAALNARPMKSYGGVSRRDLFERYDRPALQPLPAEPFVYGDWLRARVNIDYHVEVDHHYYSVPHALIHAVLDVRLAAQTVEIFQGGTRVWLHARSLQRGRHTTVPAHMPKAHRRAPGVDALAAAAAGARPSARRPRPWSSRSSRAARIPSRAIAPASGCCAWPSATARRGSRPPAIAPARRAPARIAMSTPSSSTASIASLARRSPRRRACPCTTTTCAAPRTTRTETPHDHDDPRPPPRLAPRRHGRRLSRATARPGRAAASASTSASACSSMPSTSFATIARSRAALKEAQLRVPQACLEDLDYRAAPRPRSQRRPPARDLSLGRRAPQRPDHRRHRRRQDVPRLRARRSRPAGRATARSIAACRGSLRS